MKKLLLVLSLALIIALTAAAPALAASPDDNCRDMLVNKTHLLDSRYAPSSLTALDNYMPAGGNVTMTAEAAQAAGKMYAAMKAAGISDLYGQSGYRSYSLQQTLNTNKINYYLNQGYSYNKAVELACSVVAAPGTSEHQSGLAIDFTTSANGGSLTESFANTPAGKWLKENSWKYGFILRYPADKTNITGYIYEPWHFRYVGQPHAEYMYKNGLCMEEYFSLLEEQKIITYTTVDGKEYAVRYERYNNSALLPDGQLISVSRAYADGQLGFIVTTTVPQQYLFDIVGHWAEDCIRHLASLDIIQGYTNNTVRPEKNISRAEIMTMIYRTYIWLYPDENITSSDDTPIVTKSPFADVADNAYYLQPLVFLQDKGLLPLEMITTNSSGQQFFSPDQNALRSEAALSLAPLLASRTDIPSSGIVMKDMVNADPELREAVQLLVDAGVILGNPSGNFNPNNKITRAEIMAMLDRIVLFLSE